MGKVNPTTGCPQIRLRSKADLDLEAGERTYNPDPFDSIWNPPQNALSAIVLLFTVSAIVSRRSLPI